MITDHLFNSIQPSECTGTAWAKKPGDKHTHIMCSGPENSLYRRLFAIDVVQ
jgi:hypothetical protein